MDNPEQLDLLVLLSRLDKIEKSANKHFDKIYCGILMLILLFVGLYAVVIIKETTDKQTPISSSKQHIQRNS